MNFSAFENVEYFSQICLTFEHKHEMRINSRCRMHTRAHTHTRVWNAMRKRRSPPCPLNDKIMKISVEAENSCRCHVVRIVRIVCNFILCYIRLCRSNGSQDKRNDERQNSIISGYGRRHEIGKCTIKCDKGESIVYGSSKRNSFEVLRNIGSLCFDSGWFLSQTLRFHIAQLRSIH